MIDHRLRRASLAAAVAFAAHRSGPALGQVRPDLRTAGAGLKAGGRLVIIEPETEGDDPEINLSGPYGFPTRAGYLEMFRRAGFELVSAEKKPS
jgi:hypothetical protein